MRARTFRLAIATLILVPAMAIRADPSREDEAHRLDRLETKRLNENAAQAGARTDVARRTPPRTATQAALPPSTAAESMLRRREMEAISAWRERIELCRRGVRDAC